MTEAYKELEAVSGALAKKMDELSIYKNLFQFSTDAVVIINDNGFFIDVSEEFMRIIGYSRERLLSSPFFSLMHPDDVEKTFAAYQESLKGFKHNAYPNRYLCGDGIYRLFTWTTATIVRTSVYLYSKVIVTEI